MHFLQELDLHSYPETPSSPSSHALHTSSSCSSSLASPPKLDLPCVPEEHHSLPLEEDDDAPPNFDCFICLDVSYEPVVTMCGHLFCWPCLYRWLSLHSVSQECPVCKANLSNRIFPLYGKGKIVSSHFLDERFPGIHVPCRPSPKLHKADKTIFSTTTSSASAYVLSLHRNDGSDHLRQSRYIDLGFCGALLKFVRSLLPPYTSRESGNGHAQAGGRRRRRFSNEKQFVLQWGVIFVCLLAVLGFLLF